METRRQEWNRQQQGLRQALANPEEHAKAMRLFLSQHAQVHSAAVSAADEYSFEDALWDGLPPAAARRIPPDLEHSIAWILWHLTRIEDMTMNQLAAGQEQVFYEDDWQVRLGTRQHCTGNAFSAADMTELNSHIDLNALRAYRADVGRRTRQIAGQFTPADLRQKVQPARLDILAQRGDVSPQAHTILDYWGGLKISGLLMMPPTRHSFVHLNEALRIKRKILRLPK